MHAKTAVVAVTALAVSQVSAFNTHRHKHFDRAAIDEIARANYERALEARHVRYKHTETVTTTLYFTEYVTEGAEAAPTAVFFETPESSSPAEAKATTTQKANVEEGYGGPEEAVAQEPTTTEEAAVETTAAAEEQPTTAAAAAETEAETTAAAPTATSVATGTTGGKRGLAYNDASVAQEFASSAAISWAHNWGSVRDIEIDDFCPTFWGPKENFQEQFLTNAADLIASGKSSCLFSLNEPDHWYDGDVDAGSQQSYYWLDKDETGTIDAAVALHKEVMSQFVGKALIGSPSVTSTLDANGKDCAFGSDGCDSQPYTDLAHTKSVTWLKEFRSRCGDDCPMDFVNVHYYTDTTTCDVEAFKSFVNTVHDYFPDLPVWVTEFMALCDSAKNEAFLQSAMEWMDGSDSPVARYSYFKADGSLSEDATLKAMYLDS